MVSGDADGVLKVWDLRMMVESASYDVGNNALNRLSIDRSGSCVAAACDDAGVKVFRIRNKEYVIHIQNLNCRESFDGLNEMCYDF